MPVTAISLSTGCLPEGFGVTRITASAGVFASTVVFVTSGVFVTTAASVSWERASAGERRQNAASMER
jgi:hypothetical protein